VLALGKVRMEIEIDRLLPITIVDQIKGKITYDVMCGKLEPGSALPSVRDLSAQLEVAPMTIARVYRELANESLIETKPGVGTFIADLTEPDNRLSNTAGKNLRQLTEVFLQQMMGLGYAPEDVCEAIMHEVRCPEGADSVIRVALVGNFRAATEAYARAIEAILEDLRVKVQILLMSDLESDMEGSLRGLTGVSLVITVPSRLQEVRRLLTPHGIDVVAVAFTVSSDTRRRVSAIPPGSRVGVVATYPEFLHSLLEGVLAYGLPDQQPLGAYIDQEEQVREILQNVDTVVYASGSGRILKLLPHGVEAFEYRHVPDPDSLNRLRPLLGAAETGVREYATAMHSS
jgi:DNA-binding transcriptional regulator YhcF (GntR family)